MVVKEVAQKLREAKKGLEREDSGQSHCPGTQPCEPQDGTDGRLGIIIFLLLLLLFLVVGVPSYIVYIAPIAFFSNIDAWNILCVLSTVAGVFWVATWRFNLPEQSVSSKNKALSHAGVIAMLIAILTPFLGMPVIGYELGLRMPLFIVINVAFIVGTPLAAIGVYDVIKYDLFYQAKNADSPPS